MLINRNREDDETSIQEERIRSILRMEAGLEALQLAGSPRSLRVIAWAAMISGAAVAILALVAGGFMLVDRGSLSGASLFISLAGSGAGISLVGVGRRVALKADDLERKREQIMSGLEDRTPTTESVAGPGGGRVRSRGDLEGEGMRKS